MICAKLRFRTSAVCGIAALLAGLCAVPAGAHGEGAGQWVEVEATGSRFVTQALARAEAASLASYGPFRVLDNGTAALADVTDAASPAAFAQMLRAWPHITTLRFHDCPGTLDDVANLRLGRMIRAAHLAVEVPAGGSVRSGAVELVLAGSTIAIADGSEFAVHGWIDDQGLGAADYAPDSPEHRKYLAYYRDMGLDDGAARRFYAMTNSVPFEDARWLTGAEMRGWVGLSGAADVVAEESEPALAYLDLGALLN